MGQEGTRGAVVDVDGTAVPVLQRSPHHHVIETVVVEIGHGGQGVAEPGILRLLVGVQGAGRGQEPLGGWGGEQGGPRYPAVLGPAPCAPQLNPRPQRWGEQEEPLGCLTPSALL